MFGRFVGTVSYIAFTSPLYTIGSGTSTGRNEFTCINELDQKWSNDQNIGSYGKETGSDLLSKTDK